MRHGARNAVGVEAEGGKECEQEMPGEEYWCLIWGVYTVYFGANILAFFVWYDRGIAFVIPIVTNGLHLSLVGMSGTMNLCKGKTFYSEEPWWLYAITDLILLCVVGVCLFHFSKGTNAVISWPVNAVSILGVFVCFWKTYQIYVRTRDSRACNREGDTAEANDNEEASASIRTKFLVAT